MTMAIAAMAPALLRRKVRGESITTRVQRNIELTELSS
ncbi:hypothetical protein SynMEDNS5_01649 [Synechococcus sp. MEDNS5]|nr:hypothetical protein SynMEDNS5_01649 [Synechococcus sp. MEDNS5]